MLWVQIILFCSVMLTGKEYKQILLEIHTYIQIIIHRFAHCTHFSMETSLSLLLILSCIYIYNWGYLYICIYIYVYIYNWGYIYSLKQWECSPREGWNAQKLTMSMCTCLSIAWSLTIRDLLGTPCKVHIFCLFLCLFCFC